jgi:hypothetical protein
MSFTEVIDIAKATTAWKDDIPPWTQRHQADPYAFHTNSRMKLHSYRDMNNGRVGEKKKWELSMCNVEGLS